MKGTLRVLSALLGYPGAGMRRDLPEMRDILRRESVLPMARLDELESLMASIGVADGLDAEAAYVALFDCGRATSLHLFEHVHGESRDRGPAMVDLARTYEEAGLALAPGELPDYLPLVLEYASTQPRHAARAFLGEIAHIVNSVHAAVVARGSAYAAPLAAVIELAGEKVLAVVPERDVPVDESWAEPEAFGGCHANAAQGGVKPIRIIRNKEPRGAAA